MRISDWSSDVCSSDLSLEATPGDTCEDFAVNPDGYYSGNVLSPDNPTGTGTIRELCNATGYTARNIEYYTATVANQSRTDIRSEEHTSELQSLMRTSYAVFCLKKKNTQDHNKS